MSERRLTIAGVRQAAKGGAVVCEVWGQVESLVKKVASNGNAFWEVRLRDGEGNLVLRAWQDGMAFGVCEGLEVGAAVEVQGEFFLNGVYGLDCRRWGLRRLEEEEERVFFEGGEEAVRVEEELWAELEGLVGGIEDPRLRGLCEVFLQKHGGRFRRAAAARQLHHARRGGLLAHTVQVMRAAGALCAVYEGLNRDLLVAGALFHDAGKMWECCPPERGFAVETTVRGELLGHVTLGMLLINRLWEELGGRMAEWEGLQPESELVRLHLLHVVAAHHGELEFGAPVEPRVPEAVALHYLDNLDAKLEMLRMAYEEGEEVAEGVFEGARGLKRRVVRPLGRWEGVGAGVEGAGEAEGAGGEEGCGGLEVSEEVEE